MATPDAALAALAETKQQLRERLQQLPFPERVVVFDSSSACDGYGDSTVTDATMSA